MSTCHQWNGLSPLLMTALPPGTNHGISAFHADAMIAGMNFSFNIGMNGALIFGKQLMV